MVKEKERHDMLRLLRSSGYDFAKNETIGLYLDGITKSSSVQAWWLCEKGHSFQTRFFNRLIRLSNCPYCLNHKVLTGYNDFHTRYPHLAILWNKELNEKKVEEIMPGTDEKFFWVDNCGHSWKSTPSNIIAGKRCPYCAGRKVLQGFNDLLTTHKDIEQYWDYKKNDEMNVSPYEVTAGSHKKVSWICHNGHMTFSQIRTKAKKAQSCSLCHNKATLKDNVYELYQKLFDDEWMKEKNKNIDPLMLTDRSKKLLWWKCSSNQHVVQQSIRNRIKQGCKICSDGLMVDHAYLFDEWDDEKNLGIDFNSYTAKSAKKVWWKCLKYGHSWEALIVSRTAGGNCPYCSGRKVSQGFNDLAHVKPYLLEQWDYKRNQIQPTEVTVGSERVTWWKCAEKNHSYSCVTYSKKDHCHKCFMSSSTGEKELFDFVSSLLPGYEIVANDRKIISPKEIDIFVPELMIGFEYNGLYWHDKERYLEDTESIKDVIIEDNTMCDMIRQSVSKELLKTLLCVRAGVRLLHVWEDDWLNDKDKVCQDVVNFVNMNIVLDR